MVDEPLAYLITWTTYGSWLPGEEKGWVNRDRPGIQPGNQALWNNAHVRLKQEPVTLTLEQRALVERTIRKHCEIRGWTLHAVNVRTNHVHVVVTAPVAPEKVMGEFKAWCARRLNELASAKQEWWTRHGSTKWINDTSYLENAITYTVEGQ